MASSERACGRRSQSLIFLWQTWNFRSATGGTQAADKQFTFRVSPSRVSILQEIGPDIVTVANNHALDYGTDALLDTCDTLDSAGICMLGREKIWKRRNSRRSLRKMEKKIGFLGASRVFPTGGWAAGSSHPGMFSAYDTASVVQEIQKVKKECDYLVVYVHWGIERNTQPEAYQREMGHQYIDAGADLVVGSHPHVLQGIELYHGKMDSVQSWKFCVRKLDSGDNAGAGVGRCTGRDGAFDCACNFIRRIYERAGRGEERGVLPEDTGAFGRRAD